MGSVQFTYLPVPLQNEPHFWNLIFKKVSATDPTLELDSTHSEPNKWPGFKE
jgi:hypothetical protein